MYVAEANSAQDKFSSTYKCYALAIYNALRICLLMVLILVQQYSSGVVGSIY